MLEYLQRGKHVYTGRESEGKGLLMSKASWAVAQRNIYYLKKFGIKRVIAGSLPWSQQFEDWYKSHGLDLVRRKDYDYLPTLRGTDLFMDEIHNDFPKEPYEWKEVPKAVKEWLPQSRKLGVTIYATCQDYGQVNKDFRRLVTHLYEVGSVFGPQRPSEGFPKRKQVIFGMIKIHQLQPRVFDGDQVDIPLDKAFPAFRFYTKKCTDRFDTTMLVQRNESGKLRHIERFCDQCGKNHIYHV